MIRVRQHRRKGTKGVKAHQRIQRYSFQQKVAMCKEILHQYRPSWALKVDLAQNLGWTDKENNVIHLNPDYVYLLNWRFVKMLIQHEIAHTYDPNHGHTETFEREMKRMGFGTYGYSAANTDFDHASYVARQKLNSGIELPHGIKNRIWHTHSVD